MDQKEVKDLLDKYNQGKLNPEDASRLDSWYIHQSTQSTDEMSSADVKDTIDLLKTTLPLEYSAPIKTHKPWLYFAMTAAAVALITLGAYFFSDPGRPGPAIISGSAKDIPPGKVGATLTLANGRKIRLSDATNGQLAHESGISISKTTEGQVIYDLQNNTPGHPKLSAASQYNTLSTSKGETYQLRLPDGSKIWLNAASSLTYTANLYEHGMRTVSLKGEAYFEVAKDKAHPFVVTTDKQQVKVLGTHFNVMAYTDESVVKTTLVEGSVDVNNNILKPGQQAETYKTLTNITDINTSDAIAWKNSLFVFRNENIQSIMKKISRWYDVDIEFRDKDILNKNFGGTFSRFKNVSDMLHTMELTGVIHFKIEGRRIIVMQ